MAKGLSCRFNLEDGKMVLSSGKTLASDSIWMYCIFDKFRIYTSDYGARIYQLLQRPTSYITQNRTILLSNLQNGINKYVPGVTLNSIDIGFFMADRKSLRMMIDFSAQEESNIISNNIVFV